MYIIKLKKKDDEYSRCIYIADNRCNVIEYGDVSLPESIDFCDANLLSIKQ